MSEERPTKLYTALLEAMKDFGKVKKDRQNPAFRSSYATLHSILEAVEGPLNDHGLILIQRLADEGGLALITELIHAESGQSISSYASVICAEPNNPQKVGSAITYYRRYSLLTLLNLTPEEDDDGNAASKPAQRPTGQQRYDHARQHGKDPVTNDAPMWGDIEDAMADDARRYAQRLANGATAAQSNGSAPTRPTTPAAQSAPQTPATPQTNRPPEGWTTVWTEAKAQGIKDRAALEEFMGVAPGAPLDTAAVLRQLRGQSAPSAPRHEVS